MVIRIRHRLKFSLLLRLEGQAVGTRATARSHSTIFDRLLEEIRCIEIVHLAEGYNFSHGNIVPVSEGADNMRDVTCLNRLEIWNMISKMINGMLVVGYDFWVLNFRKLGDSWCPEEESQDMLAAIPALGVLICTNIPLPGHRYQVFEAQMPLDDEFRDLRSKLSFALSVDSHGLYDIAQLKPLSDVLPDLISRFLRLIFYR